MNSSRDAERTHFLSTHGLEDAAIEPLTADASFRRYFRLTEYEPASLLMDAPPPLEDVRPFIHVAQHLKTLGFRPPDIRAWDERSGFVLLEDFGEQTFTRLLRPDRTVISEQDLYTLAVDVLLKLHSHPESNDIDVPEYNQTLLIREASLFSEWYLPSVPGSRTSRDVNSQWEEAWMIALSRLPESASCLVLRDFHVDNLMIVDTDIASTTTHHLSVEHCGLLDFQDAVTGNSAYDLVSLLQDARRDVTTDIEQGIKNYYLDRAEATGLVKDRRLFERFYRFLGAQRHAKVAGIFVRLAARDNKQGYLQHLPRVLNLLQASIDERQDIDGDFVEIRAWLNEHLTASGSGDRWPLAEPGKLKSISNFS